MGVSKLYREGVNAMCYATKRKIADCVKTLMRRKEISKIAIQDIMDATNMSRQSFYYHFKDIYDVLEWIGRNDFKNQLEGQEYDNMEKWVYDLIKVMCSEHAFYEKLAKEIEWPRITRAVKGAVGEQVHRLLLIENEKLFKDRPEELEVCSEFLATAICYYMLEYVYLRKNLSDERLERDIHFMVRMIRGTDRGMTLMFPKASAV